MKFQEYFLFVCTDMTGEDQHQAVVRQRLLSTEVHQ